MYIYKNNLSQGRTRTENFCVNGWEGAKSLCMYDKGLWEYLFPLPFLAMRVSFHALLPAFNIIIFKGALIL